MIHPNIFRVNVNADMCTILRAGSSFCSAVIMGVIAV